MKRLYQKILSGFLVFAMLLTLVPPIAVYAAEESKLPDAVALSTVLEQEVNETNITVADSVYSVETSISVKNEITSVASSDFETEDNDARLYFYGTNSSQDSQENSEAVDLEAGKATKVYVKVIAADGSASSKYTINITRAKGEKNSIEADANGKGIPDKVEIDTVLGKELTIDRTEYEEKFGGAYKIHKIYASLPVGHDVEAISVSDIALKDQTSKIVLLDKIDGSGSPVDSISLEAGEEKTVSVAINAADMSINSGYYITISRAKKDDANDNGIPDKVEIDTILGKELTIDNKEYVEMGGGAYKLHKIYASLSVDHDVEAISVSNIALKDQTSKFALIDSPTGNGSPVDSISLEAGEEKTVSIAINAADMSINSGYYITISRAKKDDANDNGIPDKVEIDTILGKEPTIDNKEYVEMGGGAYKLHKIYASLSVDHDVEAISVSNIALKDQTSKFALIDSPIGNGSPVDSISLEAGEEKTVSIAINAADMSINSGYYITISRAKKDDANDNGIPDKVDIETVLGQIPNIDSSELVSEGKEYEIEVSVTVDSEKESISSENFVLRDKNATSAFFDQHGRPTTKPVSLVAGGKTKVYLNVFADDETVTGIYTITINRSDNETVKITEFEQIKLHGGTADNTVYEDVYAVTSHLNENYSSVVILNTNDIVPVTKWTSTDNYTPNIAGDYTFTAELGDLPVGYTLGEGVTATAVVTIYDKNQSAGVKDTVLQEKLCAILNVEKNHDITVGDMMELTGTLDLSKNYDDNSIGDYSGLCHAKNITELDLSSNDLSSLMSTDKLSDLTYLTELKVLNLNGSDLTSLPNMRNMTKLEKLSVGENPLTEVSQLKELTTLKSLVMNKCNLNSLPNLKGLVNLEYLNIGENKLTTLKDSGIEELSSLIEFNAENNKLTAIDLSKLKKLTDLNLRTNKFTSLTVKDLPELTDIYVCDNALNHIELKGLPRLSKLYMGSVFGGNELTAMPDISDLTGLTEVSIWKNKLTDITGDFSKLTKLTRIDASYNQLTSISASICSITSLNTLNLQNNKINSIDENISKLTNLNALLLNKNELSDLSGGVSGLTNMTILRLDNNKFEILPDSIGDLTNLTSLSLNNNNLKTLPVSLGNLTKVEHLDMSSNKLSKFPSFISKLTALKEIAIAFNSLTDVDTDSEGNKVDLSKLTNVTNVDLSYNHIDQLPNSLKTLPNLKTIKMYSNYIANIPKNYLKDMKSLDTFMISYNYIDWDNDPVSMKEIEDFWKSNDDPTWYYDAHGLYATLKSMDTSAGLIELEDKGSDKYSYNLKAPAGTTSITITPTGASSKTKISMGDNQINSGESFTVNNLKVGVNEITLVATNEIDNKTVTYKIILNIPKAGAEILDPDHLPDGTYGLDIDAMKENENAASMTNQFITEAAKIDVKDGKMTLTMVWNRTDTIPMTWLEGLWYRDKNGEFVDMITPDDDPKTYDKYTYSENVKYNEEKKSLTITLPVQSITKDQYLKVYVPKGMGESRPVLRIVFNTDTLIDLATGEEVDTIDLVSIALDTTNAKKEYTEDEPLDLSGLVVTGTYDNGSKKTLAIIEKNVTGFDSSMPVEKQTLTVTMNGISATYDISIKEEPFSEVVIDKDHIKQDQVITSERKKIVLNEISGELAKRASVKISVRNVENAKVQIPVKSNDQGKKEAILPKLEITSNHGSVTMPGGIKVTGDENWNGKIKMPTTVENISEFSGKNIMAISLGVDGKTLNFDQPVQIVLPGQAGKKIAFVTKVGDEPKKITHTLLATQNNPEAAGKAMKDAHVAEAKLDVDGDLVIWTTHFTTFVAYEESTSDGGAGGGTNTDKLEDGEYHVSALALYKKEDKASMTQQFIKDGATLHVKNGKITATMVWRKTQFINLPEVLETLEYKNSSGQFVNAIKSKNFGNGTVTVEFEVEDINKPIIFEVYAPKGMPGATPQFRMFLGTAAENISYSSNTLTIIGNGFYEADIKILKENEDEASIAESYFLKKADVEVKDDKNYVRLFIKNKEDIKDLTVEVDGNNVECETKIVKEYDNGKKANMVKFEIPKLDATIKLKAKIVPEDNKEVTFRVSLDRDQFKKKTDDSIEAYINLLEGKVIKAVDLSKNGLYEMTMEVKETDKSLLAMVQKYLVNEVHYEVIKGKNYVQVMLKNADEIKGLKVYVNSMSAKYEKIENNERNTVIRFEVPDAGAKIRFSICMSEEKEGYTGFDIALNQATAKELQEKIYLYIQSPEIVDVKKGSIQNIKLDVAPLIEENRTLVPLRGICETLGAKVKWQAATRSISLSDGEMKIELQVDQKSAKVNGKTIKMDVAPKIINERTFVPIRFISENLKHEVRWIKEEQKIVITKKLNMVEEKDTNKKENKEKIKSNKQKQLL